MNKISVIAAVDRALRRVTEHLAGNRDPSLPDDFDAQVQRFQETLKEMKSSLESPHGKPVSYRYMGHTIVHGWPFDSEFGELVRRRGTY